MTDPKDDGLIASEADFLNTLLRQYYGDSHEVDTSDDWRTALDAGGVQGVHSQNAYTRPNFTEAPGSTWGCWSRATTDL